MGNKLKTIVTLSGLATASMHILNRINYSIYTSKNYLKYPDNNYYEWRFGKIRYIKKGNGSPLLFLHDLTAGSSVYEFHKIIENLSINHEVYAIDLLGYGLSDKPCITYTNYLYVQLIIDFIKNVIGKKTSLVATGDSAQIAVMACHNDPEAIYKMIFINPQSLYESNQIPSEQTKFLKLLLEIPVLGTFIYNLLTNKSSIERIFQQNYFYNTANIRQQDIESYLEAAHFPNHSSKYAFANYISKYMNTNIVHALKEINHSIYIIGGKEENDIDTTIENYTYYNNSIETVYIPCAKHLPHLELPEEVSSYIQVFLV